MSTQPSPKALRASALAAESAEITAAIGTLVALMASHVVVSETPNRAGRNAK